jgi:proteasome accessory factor B
VLAVDRSGGVERYRLDAGATFSDAVTLTPLEAVELRTAAAAMLADGSFPFADDLRRAIAKLVATTRAPAGESSAILPSASADESPQAQGEAVALLTTAVAVRKRVEFDYRDAKGAATHREVEPWGLFAKDGRWYLVAFDTEADAVRSFAVSRADALSVAPRPKSPDFDAPADFRVADYMLMPFQYGTTTGEAVVELTGSAARRAAALTGGRGRLTRGVDDSYIWHIPVASTDLFAGWVARSGPGIRVIEPAVVAERLRSGLAEVIRLHG